MSSNPGTSSGTGSGAGAGATQHPKEKESGWDKARESAQNVGDKAREAAGAVGDLASNAATATVGAAGKTAEKLTHSAGSSVRQLGETIKEKGPQKGMFGDATRAVGDTLQEGGRYIEQEGLNGMMDDVTELVRRNPLPAILIGVGIGFLIGRTLGS